MATRAEIRASIEAHVAAVGAVDIDALAQLYAPDAVLHDPADGPGVRGREAIAHQFAQVLSEPRRMELLVVAITGRACAFHFRATSGDGSRVDVIDTMTFDDRALITTMHAYSGG